LQRETLASTGATEIISLLNDALQIYWLFGVETRLFSEKLLWEICEALLFCSNF
jgi:hypothetical protein